MHKPQYNLNIYSSSGKGLSFDHGGTMDPVAFKYIEWYQPPEPRKTQESFDPSF
jgi:hypothetical protein